MAGSGKNSLKSVLESKGFEVKVVLKGMAEYDNVAGIWLGHLEQAMGQLEHHEHEAHEKHEGHGEHEGHEEHH
jgi:cobalamin biosynthesis Co2+ chelatase CbiK